MTISVNNRKKTVKKSFDELVKDLRTSKLPSHFPTAPYFKEYLISCPTKSGIQSTEKIIYSSFKKILDYISLNQNSNKISADVHEYYSFVFKFINTYTNYLLI